MKLHKLIIILISLQGLNSLTSTKIEPTSNEILFKSLGNLIPEPGMRSRSREFGAGAGAFFEDFEGAGAGE